MVLENQAATHDFPREYHNQKIINNILQISLEPYLFKEMLERILKYLVFHEQLNFAPKAAVLLASPETQSLTLKASVGFTEYQKSSCNYVKFGLCHCGLTAKKGGIHYYSSPAPLDAADPETLQTAGHYCVPIIRNNQPIGILALYTTEEHELSAEMEQLLESISSILATIIESQKMDQQLIELVNDLRISIISLREEKLFSESVIQSLNHGLIVSDMRGNILKSNGVAREILQPFATSLEGQNFNVVLGRKVAQKLTTLPTETESRNDRELTLTTMDGEQKIISYSIVARTDVRGRQVGLIISMTDVTELKYVHKEMEKMNRLSTVAEIASAVAHEVRNPLAGIKIMAQSIEEDASDNEQHLECSQRIIRQVDRLNEILTEFFTYARPVVPNKRPTSLTDILAEIRPLISNSLVKNHIELVERFSPKLPLIIADPNQMQQVFLNLMLNSIDAIKQDGLIEVKGRVLSKSKLALFRKKYPGLKKNTQYVMVTFADNGAGMPKEVSEKVFEPFFTTKNSGTGLGLSIVYRTLGENDAVITLQSRPGKGTMFTMFFQTES